MVCFSELTISNGPKSHSVNEDEQEEPGEGSEDEWEQVGPRNKTSVTRQADFVQTPITGIFGGHIRFYAFLFQKYLFIWLSWVLFVACRTSIFSSSMWDLVPDQGPNPGSPHWECGVLAAGLLWKSWFYAFSGII